MVYETAGELSDAAGGTYVVEVVTCTPLSTLGFDEDASVIVVSATVVSTTEVKVDVVTKVDSLVEPSTVCVLVAEHSVV